MSMMAPQGGPDLAALLGQPGAPQGLVAPPPAEDAQQGADPLQALQDAIHAVTSAMVALPDPQDTQDVATALQKLAAVQTRLMSRAAPQG